MYSITSNAPFGFTWSTNIPASVQRYIVAQYAASYCGGSHDARVEQVTRTLDIPGEVVREFIERKYQHVNAPFGFQV